jgi:hypothetical protein
MSAEERAMKFADGMCLFCGWLNHREAEYAARKKAQTFKAAGAEIQDVGTQERSQQSGNDSVTPSRMALWLTENNMF